MNFPSVRGGQGLSKGRRGLGERGGGGLEVWNKGAGAWGGSKGLGGWGLERAEGLRSGGGAGPSGDQPDGRSDGRSDGRWTYGKFTPLCYRTSSPLGPLPKRNKRIRRINFIGEDNKRVKAKAPRQPYGHPSGINQQSRRKLSFAAKSTMRRPRKNFARAGQRSKTRRLQSTSGI